MRQNASSAGETESGQNQTLAGEAEFGHKRRLTSMKLSLPHAILFVLGPGNGAVETPEHQALVSKKENHGARRQTACLPRKCLPNC